MSEHFSSPTLRTSATLKLRRPTMKLAANDGKRQPVLPNQCPLPHTS